MNELSKLYVADNRFSKIQPYKRTLEFRILDKQSGKTFEFKVQCQEQDDLSSCVKEAHTKLDEVFSRLR